MIKILTIFFVLTIFISQITFLTGCKSKKTEEEDVYVLNDDGSQEEYIEIEQDQNEKIDWVKEKERLKGIGKLDIKIFASITVILFKETQAIKQKLEKQGKSAKYINNVVIRKRDELMNYFGITWEKYNNFYKEHKETIDNFFATHPQYSKEIEIEEGYR